MPKFAVADVAFGGKGVARDKGKAVFIPFTIDGERVTAKVVREKKQFAEAQLVELIEASPHRVVPECRYFGSCGGCSYQHISYEHQLELKRRQVEQSLRRIGHFTEAPIAPIIPSPKSYGYRNRVTVHAEEGVIGYYRRDIHRLIDVEHCPIAAPEVNEALAELRARQPRDGHFTLRSHSGPRVFAQTNDEVAEALGQLVDGLLPSGQKLIDAYCGTGFFAKRLRAKFDQIIGIEWDRFAVAAAEKGAAANEIYIAGDVDVELVRHLRDADLPATSLILDPPATGLTATTRRALIDHPPNTLIYVSCNPPTQARDLRELQEQFAIQSVTPLDMFPQTAEIECVVQLTR